MTWLLDMAKFNNVKELDYPLFKGLFDIYISSIFMDTNEVNKYVKYYE